MTIAVLQAQTHPPLARDAQGNLVSVPDGTVSWRICRKTTGRPREILNHDKQPIRFPLDVTCDQLVEMCGRDVYRVYALDAVGELLDHVTTLDLSGETSELRNSSGTELAVLARPSATVSTDLRFALEAMTQMMRTNAEALRTVTEAHVDLSKSMAAAKGIRNAALFLPREPEPDDEEEEDDEPTREKTWVDLAMPFAEKLATAVPGLVAGKLAAGSAPPSNDQQPLKEPLTDEEASLVAAPNWELRDFTDLGYAKRKADAKRKHGSAKQGAIQEALQARVMRDPLLVQKLLTLKAQLTEEEVTFLLGAIARASEAEQTSLLEKLKALPDDEAVATCRQLVSVLRNDNTQKESK